MAKIKHCVYMQFKPQYSQVECVAVLQKLADLEPIMDGFLSIEFGENLDCEDKTDCNMGFIIDFSNRAALDHYANHPEHQKIGKQLVEMSVGGGDAIIVFDIEVK